MMMMMIIIIIVIKYGVDLVTRINYVIVLYIVVIVIYLFIHSGRLHIYIKLRNHSYNRLGNHIVNSYSFFLVSCCCLVVC